MVNNLQSLKLIGAGLVGAKLLMEKPDLPPPSCGLEAAWGTKAARLPFYGKNLAPRCHPTATGPQ